MWCLDPANSPSLIARVRRHWREPIVDVLWVGEGWRTLAEACHEQLAEAFPDYELIDVKVRDGALAYEAFPRPAVPDRSAWSAEEQRRFDAITGAIRERSLHVCEWCGGSGRLRADRRYVHTLCDGCDQRFGDPPWPSHWER